jgi:hypothetical protein
MQNLIEHFDQYPMVNSDRHNYIRYRIGRIKHEYWLRNRKNKEEKLLDSYDNFIIKNLKPGKTCVFGCAGYYLEEWIKDLTVVEQWPIVKKFYPAAHIIKERKDLFAEFGCVFDNFIVTNSRSDHWVNLDGLTQHLKHYSKTIKDGGVLFYSFRDTQIPEWNRLTTNHFDYFLDWAKSINNDTELNCVWKDIKFADRTDPFRMDENPDTTNGNIKFIFVKNREHLRINYD